MLSLVFGPDTVSTANMMTDLAHGLQNRGHEVTVLTSMPHYNPSQRVLCNPVYRAQVGKIFTEAHESGVRVLRVYMPLKGQRVWRRAIDYLWFHLVTLIIAATKVSRQDVIFVPSPPITLGLEGYVLAKLLGGKLIYDVRELWPDVPVRLGLIRNRFLVRMVYAIEGFVYRRSSGITSIAECFIAGMVKRGVPREKLYFTPNFVDVAWISPGGKSNSFSREHGMESKYVAFYGGNIGLTQGLEILVEIGKELEEEDDIVLLVIGDGAGRTKLEQAIRDSGLKNIHLLPFQPQNRVPDVYATADVCLSPMRFGFSYDTVPSKIYTAMAAGRPVISASESDTESAELVRDSRGGLVVAPESPSEMAQAIRSLHSSPEIAREMGRNARQWIIDHYSKDAVIASYDQVIQGVVENAGKE
jgi:colanic acid biosynthesis glycosyl transferase WcaI